MMLVSELQILLSVFVLGVFTSPVLDASSSMLQGRTVKLSRRCLQQSPANASFIHLFNATFAKREMSAVLVKYQNASRILQGVGLEQNLTSYYPLGDYLFNTSYGTPGTLGASLDNKRLISPVIVSGTGIGIMPLTDYMFGTLDVLYYGPAEFGTPPQQLTVDIDTGSADLWIPAGCYNCDNNQFDPMMSSTYRNRGAQFAVTYGSGDVSGTLATDVVSIAGLTVKKQAFGVVELESEDFKEYPNDGLIGMAFGSIASCRKPTFFENLIRTNQVAKPSFSVYLSRNQESGSEVCLGCYDATKAYGPISWVPVKSKTYWSVAMDGLASDSTSMLPTDIIAAIDTGTTLIYVPEDTATKFYNMIPGAKPATNYGSGYYTFPCSACLDISLWLGGQPFSLNSLDFNVGRIATDSPDCVGGILSFRPEDSFPSNLAIIGDIFMKSWYTTFDYDHGARVGFSPSINNKH